jgi:hypothetical protein
MLSSVPGHPIGFVTLPAGRSFLMLRNDPEGAVIAETTSAATSHRLALPPGRYFVRGRGSDDLVEGLVLVRADTELSISETQLDRVAYARLVRKGGGAHERLRGLQAGYLLRTGLWRNSDPCQGAFAAYEIVTRGLSLTARASGCRGGFQNQPLSSAADDLNLQIEGAHVWDLPIISLHAGLASGRRGYARPSPRQVRPHHGKQSRQR